MAHPIRADERDPGHTVRRRGRPPKFDRPSQMVALTLPEDVIEGLRGIDADLAWAIVTLFERHRGRSPSPARPQPEAGLVSIAGRRSLIVVDRSVFTSLPGIHIIPLNESRAFLALEPGRGMSDLELAVLDRLDDSATPRDEREALLALRAQLRAWRHDPDIRFHTRAIIVVEHLKPSRRRPPRGQV